VQRIAIACLGILLGCGHTAAPRAAPAPVAVAPPAIVPAPAAIAPVGLTKLELVSDNGLSDLALDDHGAAWVVAERSASAYRIVLDPGATKVVSSARFPVDGVPPDTDLEAIAWLAPDRFAIGVEGHAHGAARVYLAELADGRIKFTRTIDLSPQMVGLPIADNDGVEGVCGAGQVIFASIESTAQDDAGRWAPIIRIDLADPAAAPRVTRLPLTSAHGKISALHCAIDADGTAHLIAIERHFDVSRIVTADVPRDAAANQRLVSRVVRDLTDELGGKLNLEGIAPWPDGRWLTVVDNQYDKITGPNLLVVVGAKAP
jgi:hypothetical protein